MTAQKTEAKATKSHAHCIEFQLSATGWVGHFSAMASPCEIHINSREEIAKQHITRGAEIAWAIEKKFSRYRDDNIIHAINNSHNQPVSVDEETAGLLNFAQTCYELSDGLFDITSGVLRKIWHFDGSDSLPSRKQAKALLPFIGWEKVQWQQGNAEESAGKKNPADEKEKDRQWRICLPQGMQIDLGGLGKEYAVDKASQIIAELTTAAFLINFGGDLYANKPPQGKPHWQIGIESIGGADHKALVQLSNGALATSGDARKFLQKGKKRYSHILNPKTAWPVSHAPSSVTVAAPQCINAGFLSTLALLKGKHAETFLKAQDTPYWIQ